MDVQASTMVEGRSVRTQSERCEHVQFILTACKLHAEVSTICIWIHIDRSKLRHDDGNKTASRVFEYNGMNKDEGLLHSAGHAAPFFRVP